MSEKETTKQTFAEIECDICGTFFTPTHKNNILCPDCKTHPEQKRKRMAMQIERSKRMYDPYNLVPRYTNCEICGNKFRQYHSETTCGPACYSKKRILGTTCTYCGKPMIETDDQHATDRNEKWFCSEECKAKYNREYEEEMGYVRICKFCGKEFTRRQKKEILFCSRECSKNAVKAGYKREYTRVCVECDKQFKTTKYNDMFCNEQCEYQNKRRNTDTIYNTPFDAFMAKHKSLTEPAKHAEPAEPKKSKAPVSLCTDCRTSYKDCDYMSSNFRIKPKGAKYENSIITSCPYYTPPKRKNKQAV